VPNPTTGKGVNPKWDFASQSFSGNNNAFVIAATNGTFLAPTGQQDIAWVHLDNIQGSLSQEVYRVDTRGGQPPAKVCIEVYSMFFGLSLIFISQCTGNSTITVKYAAKYCKWL
jgi:Protein of unknown function (DUF3455)